MSTKFPKKVIFCYFLELWFWNFLELQSLNSDTSIVLLDKSKIAKSERNVAKGAKAARLQRNKMV